MGCILFEGTAPPWRSRQRLDGRSTRCNAGQRRAPRVVLPDLRVKNVKMLYVLIDGDFTPELEKNLWTGDRK